MNSQLRLLLAAALLIGTFASSMAQSAGEIFYHPNRIFAEIGGPSNIIGIGYERQLMKTQKIFLRTGISYFGNSDSHSLCGDYFEDTPPSDVMILDKDFSGPVLHDHYLSMPVGLTFLLFPNHRAHIELGAGLVGSLQFVEEQNMRVTVTEETAGDDEIMLRDPYLTYTYKALDKKHKTLLKGYGYFNFGYRFEADNGFLIRAGLSMIVHLDSSSKYFGSLGGGLLSDEDMARKYEKPGIYEYTFRNYCDDDADFLISPGIYFSIGYAF